MRIERTYEKLTDFKNLNTGDVFTYENGGNDVFMKVNVSVYRDNDGEEWNVNAADLRDGYMYFLREDERVYALSAKLVIE